MCELKALLKTLTLGLMIVCNFAINPPIKKRKSQHQTWQKLDCFNFVHQTRTTKC